MQFSEKLGLMPNDNMEGDKLVDSLQMQARGAGISKTLANTNANANTISSFVCICIFVFLFVFVFACLQKKLQRQTALPAGGE